MHTIEFLETRAVKAVIVSRHKEDTVCLTGSSRGRHRTNFALDRCLALVARRLFPALKRSSAHFTN
jgi:hypothetical protein